jgi:hypothetical protein
VKGWHWPKRPQSQAQPDQYKNCRIPSAADTLEPECLSPLSINSSQVCTK